MFKWMTQKLVNETLNYNKNIKVTLSYAFTETRSFRSFLQQHINLAFARGFDDNVGRHSTPAYFEVKILKSREILAVKKFENNKDVIFF